MLGALLGIVALALWLLAELLIALWFWQDYLLYLPFHGGRRGVSRCVLGALAQQGGGRGLLRPASFLFLRGARARLGSPARKCRAPLEHACRKLRFNVPGYRSPAERRLAFEEVLVPSGDAVVHSWLLLQPQSAQAPTIIFFHGNAGNIGYRLPQAQDILSNTACNLLMVDYRGYGSSEGQPSFRGLQQDAEAVLNYLATRADIEPRSIFLYGQSLGGGERVLRACALAALTSARRSQPWRSGRRRVFRSASAGWSWRIPLRASRTW